LSKNKFDPDSSEEEEALVQESEDEDVEAPSRDLIQTNARSEAKKQEIDSEDEPSDINGDDTTDQMVTSQEPSQPSLPIDHKPVKPVASRGKVVSKKRGGRKVHQKSYIDSGSDSDEEERMAQVGSSDSDFDEFKMHGDDDESDDLLSSSEDLIDSPPARRPVPKSAATTKTKATGAKKAQPITKKVRIGYNCLEEGEI